MFLPNSKDCDGDRLSIPHGFGRRATARVSTPHLLNPRPYNDYDGGLKAFIVGATLAVALQHSS